MPLPLLPLSGFLAAIGAALRGKPAPVAPSVVGDALMNRILKTIRTVESGGSYTIKNDHSSASGAYQFLDTTWNHYGGYRRAADAPPDVQDAKARENVNAILKRHGGAGAEMKWVPASWYVGSAGAEKLNWNTVVPGNNSSVAQYVTKWLNVFARTA